MDAFFIKTYEYEHPYFLRLWCSSTHEDSSLLLTFDGVKIRLINFLSHQTIKEIDFLKSQSLSYVTSIYHPGYPSKAIFLFVRERRNIWAYDDQLANIPSLSLDTSLIILAMVWSQQKQILYISGNFGWMRALRIKVTTSIAGSLCEWVPVWTKHESGQWMQHLALDEPRGYLFGASGVDVFVWSLSDGQLLLQFDSKHTHAITSLKYSPDHLMLFTGSSDGTIKIWRIFDRKPDLIRVLKQIDLGPMLMQIDASTIISITCERVLRRYNMLNGSVLGAHDLEPAVSLDQKNIDSPLQIELGFTENIHGKHEWLFESEGFKISVFEVHYAPRELAVCCDVVSHMVIDEKSTVYAVCRNGVLHILNTNASEQKTIDLDTIPLVNDPNHALNPSNILHVEYSKGFLYLAFESGEIKVLNTSNFRFYNMKEADLGKCITSLCTTDNILTSRHNYCPSSADYHSLVLSCSSNGGFTIHCALCYNFIASWKLQNDKILQMKPIPNKNLLAAIDECHFVIFKESNNMLVKCCSFEFDEEEYASLFSFPSDNLIIVGLVSGKGVILDLIEDENSQNISLKQRLIIRMHSNKITTILSCTDLKKIDECKDLFDSFNLDGIVCSIGVDDTLKIFDCFTGILQYSSVLPVHSTLHTATFVYQAKIMLAISIDQNIRLFDWPGFERLLPSAHETPRSEPKAPDKNIRNFNLIDDSDDEEYIRPSVSFNTLINNQKEMLNEKVKSLLIDEENQEKNKQQDEINENQNKNMQNVEIKPLVKKKKVDLVFQNGFPKLKFTKINRNEEEEEEEEEINDEEINNEEESIKEVEIKNDLYLNDILKDPSMDESIERNRRILEDAILNDPEIENTIKSKKVKKITRIKEEDEFNDDDFYSYLFSTDVKHYEQHQKKRPKTTTTPRSTNIHQQFKFRGLPLEKPEKIPKIGNRRKSKNSGRAKHFLILEFEDGKKLKTSELTINMLKEIANAKTKETEDVAKDLTPGWVFQKALSDLSQTKNVTPKRLLIREQELVALPIFTLTSGGVNVGGNYKRFFTNKPSKKFYEESYSPSMITNAHNGNVKVNRFMHWEGVEFEHLFKKSNVVGMRTVVEEIKSQEEEEGIEDDDDDIGSSLISEILRKARKKRRSKLRLKNSSSTSSMNSFDPNNSSDSENSDFNFFEKDNPLSKALVTASPSVSAITQMINDDDDNPLLSLISNTPSISPSQLMAQVDDDRLSQIAMWQRQTGDDVAIPNIVNTFTFEGLPNGFKQPSSSNERVSSPRAMDAFVELTKRMEINQPILPVISEDSFNETSSYSSSASDNSDDDDEEDEDEELIFLKSQIPTKLTRTQSIIQEYLQRNDFKALKDALNYAGLICDNGLVDLPRWQPTVNFMTRHQKGVHPFSLTEQIEDNTNPVASTSKIRKDDNSKSQINFIEGDSSTKNVSERPRTKPIKTRKNFSKSLSINHKTLANDNDHETKFNDDSSIVSKNEDDKINKKNPDKRPLVSSNTDEVEEEEEEDVDVNDIIASVTNPKVKDYISKIDLNKAKSDVIYRKRKQLDKSSAAAISTDSVNSKRSAKKLDKDFGLSRDGKKLYKVPKNRNTKDKFKKYDPIEEIQIKSKTKKPNYLVGEFLPNQKKFKSTTIKSLLKERVDHIDIDFGDPHLYKAELKKYYIKDLQKKGPRFQRHKIGTKNPLFMAHASDSDSDGVIIDETIKNIDKKKIIRKTNSFAAMPLPRLSPRDESDSEKEEENEEGNEEDNEEEDDFARCRTSKDKEEEEEDFSFADEEIPESEYEYEYETDNETGEKAKVKNKEKKFVKEKSKTKLNSEMLKLKNIPKTAIGMKNPLNLSSQSSSRSMNRVSSRSSRSSRSSSLSSRSSSRVSSKKKPLTSIEGIPSDDEGQDSIIVGTLKSKGNPVARRRRTNKKPKKVTEKESDDLLKEMDELLKDVETENKNENEAEEIAENVPEEEEEIKLEVEEEDQVDTLVPLPNETPPDSSKKLKKRYSKVRKSKAGSKSDLDIDEDEARELFESLINATQTANQANGAFGGDMSLFGNEFMKNRGKKEKKKFGDGLTLLKKNEFRSIKKKKVVTVKKVGWNINCRVRYNSTNNLHKSNIKFYERRKMFLLGRLNMNVAPDIFLSYDAQTLWDPNIGKMRRSSFDASTKDMKKF